MSSNTDTNDKHIEDERLAEISRGTATDFLPEERTHVERCERCARLLAAFFKVAKGD
jgi:hypothetical protein